MYPKTLAAAVVTALTLTFFGAAPAQAADTVKINKIASKKAPYKKSVTIKPAVKKSGNVSLDKQTLTIRKGKKTVARNKKSAKLKAGTYKVTTTAKYRTFRYGTKPVLKTPVGGEVLSWEGVVDDPAAPTLGACTVTTWYSEEDFHMRCGIRGATRSTVDAHSSNITLWYSMDRPTGVGQDAGAFEILTPVNLYINTRVRNYSSVKTKSRTQTLKISQGKKPPAPAKCATYKNFKKVKNDMSVAQVKRLLGPSTIQYDAGEYKNRQYKPCNKSSYFVVLFEYGYVWDKMYAS